MNAVRKRSLLLAGVACLLLASCDRTKSPEEGRPEGRLVVYVFGDFVSLPSRYWVSGIADAPSRTIYLQSPQADTPGGAPESLLVGTILIGPEGDLAIEFPDRDRALQGAAVRTRRWDLDVTTWAPRQVLPGLAQQRYRTLIVGRGQFMMIMDPDKDLATRVIAALRPSKEKS